MADRIRRAVIPAAGLGTRFLPATKSIPKEMLPIVDRPGILYIVEEAVAAGIQEIVLIQGRHKTALEDLFDRNVELEEHLEKNGQTQLLKMVQDITNKANIISVRQKNPLGLGHAVWCAQPVVGREPFAVLLGDELTVGQPTVTQQLADVFYSEKKSTVAIMEVAQDDTKKYGIVGVQPQTKNVYKVTEIVEKPEPSKAPSRWALPGRYVFTADIFEHLRNTKPGKGGEIQLTDAMVLLMKEQGLLAMSFKNKRYDAGDKLGFLQANVEFALEHKELGQAFKAYLKDLVKKL